MCFDSGSDTSTTNTVQTSNLPAWVQSAGQANVDLANQIAGTPYQTYTGPRVAGFSTDQNSGFQAIRDTTGAWRQPLDAATGVAASVAGSNYGQTFSPNSVSSGTVTAGQLAGTDLTPYINPYTSNVLDTTIQRINDQYGQMRLANNARATQAGAFGGSRHGVAEGMLGRDAARQVADSTGQIMSQAFQNAQSAAQQDINQRMNASLANQSQALSAQQFNANQALQAFNANAGQYNTEQGRALAAGQMLGQLGQSTAQLGLNDALAQISAGQQQQAQTQKGYDTAYQDFLDQRNWPQQMLNMRIAALSGTPYDKTASSSATGPGANTTAQSLGALGALAGGIGALGGTGGIKSVASAIGDGASSLWSMTPWG